MSQMRRSASLQGVTASGWFNFWNWFEDKPSHRALKAQCTPSTPLMDHQYREALQPVGMLGNKTPRQIAAEPVRRSEDHFSQSRRPP